MNFLIKKFASIDWENAFLGKAYKLLIFPHFVIYYIQFQPHKQLCGGWN